MSNRNIRWITVDKRMSKPIEESFKNLLFASNFEAMPGNRISKDEENALEKGSFAVLFMHSEPKGRMEGGLHEIHWW